MASLGFKGSLKALPLDYKGPRWCQAESPVQVSPSATEDGVCSPTTPSPAFPHAQLPMDAPSQGKRRGGQPPLPWQCQKTHPHLLPGHVWEHVCVLGCSPQGCSSLLLHTSRQPPGSLQLCKADAAWQLQPHIPETKGSKGDLAGTGTAALGQVLPSQGCRGAGGGSSLPSTHSSQPVIYSFSLEMLHPLFSLLQMPITPLDVKLQDLLQV